MKNKLTILLLLTLPICIFSQEEKVKYRGLNELIFRDKEKKYSLPYSIEFTYHLLGESVTNFDDINNVLSEKGFPNISNAGVNAFGSSYGLTFWLGFAGIKASTYKHYSGNERSEENNIFSNDAISAEINSANVILVFRLYNSKYFETIVGAGFLGYIKGNWNITNAKKSEEDISNVIGNNSNIETLNLRASGGMTTVSITNNFKRPLSDKLSLSAGVEYCYTPAGSSWDLNGHSLDNISTVPRESQFNISFSLLYDLL